MQNNNSDTLCYFLAAYFGAYIVYCMHFFGFKFCTKYDTLYEQLSQNIFYNKHDIHIVVCFMFHIDTFLITSFRFIVFIKDMLFFRTCDKNSGYSELEDVFYAKFSITFDFRKNTDKDKYYSFKSVCTNWLLKILDIFYSPRDSIKDWLVDLYYHQNYLKYKYHIRFLWSYLTRTLHT